jgi:acyl-CoA synthetase (AMP-forming)/AMP-acid ligase II
VLTTPSIEVPGGARPGTLGALLEHHAGRHPDKPFVVRVDDAAGDAALSYGDAVRRGRALAGWLEQEAGLRTGDRVAVLLDNASVLEVFTTFAACWLGGFAAIPVNARSAPPEIAHVLEHSGARVVVTAPPFRAALAVAQKTAPVDRVLVVGPAGDADVAFADALDAGLLPRLPAPGPEDACAVLYTSGTTGRPKGALFRHAGCVANADILRSSLRIAPDSRMLLAVPVFTSTGTHTFPLPHLAAGATLLFETGFDPQAWPARARRTAPTAYFGVPAMLALLLDTVGDDAVGEIAGIRQIVFGGSPMMPSLADRLLRAFPGAGLRNVYGMTESGPAGTTLQPEDATAHLATVGRAMAGIDVRVVDEAGGRAPAGEVGEILLRTPGRMAEYLDDPAATARAIDADGWLRTGDLGRLDDEGFLTLVDRANDTIVRGGFNVYPAEVEGALARHPAVLEAAVAGKPHPVLGEDVVAWVVLREGATATADELKASCRPLISDYKCPRDLRLVDALPRNAMGKLLRRELRASTLPDRTAEAVR